MLEHTEYVKLFVGLLAIVNPLGAIPIFVSMTYGADSKERARIARVIGFTVSIILIVALFLGEALLDFFGITVDSFRVAGGILILLMAISMMHAKASQVTQTQDEMEEGIAKDSAAVVPLSMPLLAGPGAISTVILYGHKYPGIVHDTIIGLEIILLGVLLWIVFQLTPAITKRIGRTGINIVTRIMGLILAAIAIEFIANGLKGIFPSLGAV